jgi:hypothetical protein
MTTNAPHLHLTEDDLVLHYYGEMSTEDETAAATHLAGCSDCRREYQALQRVLGVIDEAAAAPIELPPSFERTVWTRLEPNLRQQRRGWIGWMLFSPAPMALAAAVVVLVLGAFFAGRALSPAAAPPATADGASPDQIRERILLIDLGEHLDRSQMILVELVSNEDSGSVDVSGERARAEQLVADNRLYRQTAEETGDRAITDLLDEIDRVLTEVAASPDQLSSEELAEVRRRIESRDLLFKVRVVSSEVRQRQRESIQAKAGPRS